MLEEIRELKQEIDGTNYNQFDKLYQSADTIPVYDRNWDRDAAIYVNDFD